MATALFERGLCIAGDSAHSLSPFFITPHDVNGCKDEVNGSHDAFNFYLSSWRIENRGDSTADDKCFQDFSISYEDRVQRDLSRMTGELPMALVTDNNEPKKVGRPTMEEAKLSKLGNQVHDRLTVKLASHGMRRPLHSNMKYNQSGNVHMTS